MKKRMIVDIAMAVLLPVLMAYSLIGETLHEWFGAAMFVLFIVHHVLNRKWFSGLRHGTWSAVRKLNTGVDLLMFVLMLLMMASALTISQHVFAFLGLGGAAVGRIIHLAGSAWLFVFMSLHIGLHGQVMAGRMGITKNPKPGSILRVVFLLIAAYGCFAFVRRDLASRLFVRTFFAWFDFSEPVIFFLLDYVSMMILFAVIAYYLAKLLARRDAKKQEKRRAAVLENPEEEERRLAGLKAKKKKKRRIILAALGAVVLIAALVWGIPYFRRHFVTVQIDRTQAVEAEPVDLGKTLVISFTRTGNTDFAPDVDAVSSASLMLDETGTLVGNAELLAQIAAKAAGAENVPIRVAKLYPSSYGDTVSVAGEELRSSTLPKLVEDIRLPQPGDYDTVILVFPLWWSTVPKPVEAYVRQLDWSGQTVHLILTHGGGGTGTVPRDLAAMLQNGELDENVLLIYDDDADEAAPAVEEWLKSIK